MTRKRCASSASTTPRLPRRGPVRPNNQGSTSCLMSSTRSLALKALERWRRGTEFADKIVANIFARTSLGSSDRAFVHELFYGVLRNLSLLDFWIAKLRSEAVNSRARAILRLG